MQKKKPFRDLLRLAHRLFPGFTQWIYETIYFLQRGLYGWSERDCWAVDTHLSAIIPEMLSHLKATKHGVPQKFVNLACLERGIDRQFMDYKIDVDRGDVLYEGVLDEIIDGFRAHENLSYTREHRCPEYQLDDDLLRRKFNRGMELFVKYYDDLWD
jgi:hypothetical protein